MYILEKENCSSYAALAESAAKIAYYNFKWHYATFIFINATFSCGVDVFIQSYNKNVITGQHIYNAWFVESTTQFVLFVKNNVDLTNKLHSLQKEKFNNGGYYLIVCNSMEYECDETEAVDILWRYRISNVILIKYDRDGNAEGSTYFQEDSCGAGIPRKLKYWDACIQRDSVEDCRKNMFPLKFKNFHRCPLIVSTFEQDPYMFFNDGVPSGADGGLLRVIIEALNATLVIVTPTYGKGWGSFEANGTWSGSFGDIYYDRANFSMTSASATLHRVRAFQMSTNYNTVYVGWVTHPADLEASSFKLLRTYSASSRLAISLIISVVMFIELILSMGFWKNVTKKFGITINTSSLILPTWQIFMGLPLKKLPKKWFFKYLILFWIWFCYILRTYYSVYLISCLQTDIRIENVASIEEAIEEGYPYGGGLALKDYYLEQPYIYDNWKVVDPSEIFPTMIKLSEGLKFVLAMNLETTKRFLSTNPGRKLHKLPQKIINSPTVIYFKKYSMIAPSINEILTHLFEAGISDKLLEDFTSNRRQKNENKSKPIKLEHLKGCFGLLTVGWTLSFVIAILEKIVHRRNKK